MQRSVDGTIKNAVTLHDGLIVGVGPHPGRKTDHGVRFFTSWVQPWVSGFVLLRALKRMRNLSPDEIYDQVAAIRQQSELFFGRPLTNIVFMGMGEPLLNYANVVAAIDKITSPKGLNMASKRITVSTVGIAKMIIKWRMMKSSSIWQSSLHSAVPETRSSMMPINDSNPLSELGEALAYWYKKRKRKVTYEYVVWEGINDSRREAEALLAFCKIIPSKVNLIEYNPIGGRRISPGWRSGSRHVSGLARAQWNYHAYPPKPRQRYRRGVRATRQQKLNHENRFTRSWGFYPAQIARVGRVAGVSRRVGLQQRGKRE